LVTNPVIMPAKEDTDVILVQYVMTNTSHMSSCIVMLKDVIKVSLFQKGQTIGSRISSLYFMSFNVPWTILSWMRPSWQILAQTITLPPLKQLDSYTHWSVKRSPRLWYTRWRPSLKRSENRDSSLKRIRFQAWSLQDGLHEPMLVSRSYGFV
jgi:hypothetical protein